MYLSSVESQPPTTNVICAVLPQPQVHEQWSVVCCALVFDIPCSGSQICHAYRHTDDRSWSALLSRTLLLMFETSNLARGSEVSTD